jgi:hypothetical protein
MNKTWKLLPAALLLAQALTAQDLQAPQGLEDIGNATPYTLQSSFENIIDTALMATPVNMDPLGFDTSSVASSFSTFNTESEDDPGGPGNPTNDLPINGGICLLFTTALGAGYRSYKRTNNHKKETGRVRWE